MRTRHTRPHLYYVRGIQIHEPKKKKKDRRERREKAQREDRGLVGLPSWRPYLFRVCNHECQAACFSLQQSAKSDEGKAASDG